MTAGVNHAATGASIEATDYQSVHVIDDASIPVAKISGLGSAATANTGDFDVSGAAAAAQAASDPSGSATTAQTNAEGYTDSSIAALTIPTQAQILTRQLGA